MKVVYYKYFFSVHMHLAGGEECVLVIECTALGAFSHAAYIPHKKTWEKEGK